MNKKPLFTLFGIVVLLLGESVWFGHKQLEIMAYFLRV